MGLYRKYIKRVIDFFSAIFFISILLFPFLLIAVIIKITSKGPVFFKQERFGQNTKPFTLYKFRSMSDKAPIKSNAEFINIQTYITPFGMFLRKTSIDELPQLINILKGEMSFIGPRPLASTDKKVLNLRKKSGADRVLPGISGLAQVSGRNNVSDDDKARYDQIYADNISFKIDISLIMTTVQSVIKRKDIFKERK